MEPRTMTRGATRDPGYPVQQADAPCSPTIPRTIDGIELNQAETLGLIARMEDAIDGGGPVKACGADEKRMSEPGIMERLGGVNHTSLEIRQRLESLLAKLVK